MRGIKNAVDVVVIPARPFACTMAAKRIQKELAVCNASPMWRAPRCVCWHRSPDAQPFACTRAAGLAEGPAHLLQRGPQRRGLVPLASHHHGPARVALRWRCLLRADSLSTGLPVQAAEGELQHQGAAWRTRWAAACVRPGGAARSRRTSPASCRKPLALLSTARPLAAAHAPRVRGTRAGVSPQHQRPGQHLPGHPEGAVEPGAHY